jgi:hypothetical protein
MAQEGQGAPPSEAGTLIPPEYFTALGHAIDRWQSVEHALCAVFEKVSSCRDANVARAIFYSPMDFSEKLKFVRAAAREALTKEDFEEWEKLRRRAEKDSLARNCLAHFEFVPNIVATGSPTIRSDGNPSYRGEVRYLLMPNLFDPNVPHKDASKRTPLTADDIRAARRRFNDLAAKLRQFAAHIPLLTTPP